MSCADCNNDMDELHEEIYDIDENRVVCGSCNLKFNNASKEEDQWEQQAS